MTFSNSDTLKYFMTALSQGGAEVILTQANRKIALIVPHGGSKLE